MSQDSNRNEINSEDSTSLNTKVEPVENNAADEKNDYNGAKVSSPEKKQVRDANNETVKKAAVKQTSKKTSWSNKAIAMAALSVFVVVALVTGMIFMTKFMEIKRLNDALNQGTSEMKYNFDVLDGRIPISKNGRNVVVIMLDRAIGAYVPYIFDELPELLDSYQGFTYYPNTISYGQHTNFAVPALYGGYEYTPVEINKRDTELLVDKHNEALKVLPVLFSQNGYWSTVCDPPYANYQDIPDVSIFDGYENINAFNLIDYPGDYSVSYYPEENPWLFDNNFEALTSLSDTTLVMNNSQNTFAFIQNDATHYPKLLKTPGYEIPEDGETVSIDYPLNYEVDGKVMYMENESQVSHYHVNVACLKALGEWLDYLKENGVYDNTKIIITSDHGFGLYQFDDLWMSEGRDVEFVNPLLLVKDFNADGDLKTDNTFMTNADVPALATAGAIKDPTNPFTGNPINSNAKTESNPLTTTSDLFYITTNNGTVFDTSDGQWWSVHDDIRVESNWNLEE